MITETSAHNQVNYQLGPVKSKAIIIPALNSNNYCITTRITSPALAKIVIMTIQDNIAGMTIMVKTVVNKLITGNSLEYIYVFEVGAGSIARLINVVENKS